MMRVGTCVLMLSLTMSFPELGWTQGMVRTTECSTTLDRDVSDLFSKVRASYEKLSQGQAARRGLSYEPEWRREEIEHRLLVEDAARFGVALPVISPLRPRSEFETASEYQARAMRHKEEITSWKRTATAMVEEARRRYAVGLRETSRITLVRQAHLRPYDPERGVFPELASRDVQFEAGNPRTEGGLGRYVEFAPSGFTGRALRFVLRDVSVPRPTAIEWRRREQSLRIAALAHARFSYDWYSERRDAVIRLEQVQVYFCDTGTIVYDVRPGSLAMTSPVPGVAVWFDGEKVGETTPGAPLTIDDIHPGTYKLKATKTGYTDWERNVTIAARRRADIVIDIENKPGLEQLRSFLEDIFDESEFRRHHGARLKCPVALVFFKQSTKKWLALDVDPSAECRQANAAAARFKQDIHYLVLENVVLTRSGVEHWLRQNNVHPTDADARLR